MKNQRKRASFFSSLAQVKLLSFFALLMLIAITLALLPIIFLSQQHEEKTGQTSTVGGKTYYISKNGNNSDGRSWSTAWNELDQIKWTNIQPGDMILLDGGSSNMVYTETLNIGKSGTQAAPITIRRTTEPGRNGKVVIFGGRSIPLPYCGQPTYLNQTVGITQFGIDFGANSWVIIDGMSWDGVSIYGHNGAGVDFSHTSSNNTVRNVEVYDNGHAYQQRNGTWQPDNHGDGVNLSGSNLTFEQMDIHDNGDDAFEGGGRQASLPNGAGAVVNNVTIRNTLFLNKVINVMGYPSLKEHNWTLDHVTVFSPGNAIALWIEGSGHSVTNSIFYGGQILLPDGLAASSGNCQWNTSHNTTALVGQTLDPRLVTDVSTFNVTTPLAQIANAHFALQANSPCAGKGSSITSVHPHNL